MKTALILNVINPNLGGVLIRGEKGTAKSTAVRALAELLPLRAQVKGCRFGCDPQDEAHMCDECREHFDKVQSYLKAQNIDYTVNPRIVRGLDYYTKTVFEFVSDSIGAQGTVCGGGRYDGLIDELGGQKTPSLGFAVGLERLQLLMEAQGCAYPEPEKADLFIIALGDKATGKALELAGDMRGEGFAVLMDLNQRSLRAQMKYANKLGARYTVVLGDNEVDTDRVQLKAMDTGEETEVALSTFVNGFYSVSMQAQLADLEINGEAFDFTSLFQTGETE